MDANDNVLLVKPRLIQRDESRIVIKWDVDSRHGFRQNNLTQWSYLVTYKQLQQGGNANENKNNPKAKENKVHVQDGKNGCTLTGLSPNCTYSILVTVLDNLNGNDVAQRCQEMIVGRYGM